MASLPVERHKVISKAHEMKFVIPMKEGIEPKEMSAGFKDFIYEEFASRYLESIGAEPTKANILLLQEKYKILPQELELVPKYKANGCIRDELEVAKNLMPRKQAHPELIQEADLYQKVVNAGKEMVEGGPIGHMHLLAEEEDEEGGVGGTLPTITGSQVVDKQDIRDPFEPTKQDIQRALADFSSLYPLTTINRPLTEGQRTEIDKLLQCELIVDLVQTLCYFLHDRIFRMGSALKNPRFLCRKGESHPVPPLDARAYEATIWRIHEAISLLVTLAGPNPNPCMLTVVFLTAGLCAAPGAVQASQAAAQCGWCLSVLHCAFGGDPAADTGGVSKLDADTRWGDLFGRGRGGDHEALRPKWVHAAD